LKKKIEKRFGQFEAIRHVAPLVFVNRFLAPWIEFPRAEGVIHFEKYLRGRDDTRTSAPFAGCSTHTATV
jgi:hypothetical protein